METPPLIKFLIISALAIPLIAARHLSNHPKTEYHMKKPKINLAALQQPHWDKEELNNATTVVEFMQLLMNEHEFETVLKKFGHSNYVQHNRNLPDGIEGLVAYMKKITKRFPEYSYDVKHIICSGDLVVFHSHMTFKEKHRGNEKKGFLVNDTWKLENGKIIKHWDALQPLDGNSRFLVYLTGGKIRNSNGLF